MNCPILEQTADGATVGRCWYHLTDGHTCPRHGDIAPEVAIFRQTGKLVAENTLRLRLGQKRRAKT